MTNKSIQLLFGVLCLVLCAQSIQAQITHNDDSRSVNVGSRLILQHYMESANNWSRGYLGSNLRWNETNDVWDIGYGSQTDFAMIHFTNGSNISFYSGTGTGSQYSLSNSQMESYARMMISNKGFVGIGTNSPLEKLHVSGGSVNDLIWPAIVNNSLNQQDVSGYGVGLKLKLSNNSENKWSGIAAIQETSWANGTGLALYANESEYLRISNVGNVGIGTITPDYKLEVNGTIHSKEVKVDLDFTLPDYVFDDDYNLTTLEETSTYINENHHLPDVPSAKEMEAEGINLGEMNMLLLKKIEELTLHLIEKNNQLNMVKVDVALLQKKIATIEIIVK